MVILKIGIPDLIKIYAKFRSRLSSQPTAYSGEDGSDDPKVPQLIITGHGSVDDPDGSLVSFKDTPFNSRLAKFLT